jgi:hypothetical protein
LGVCVAARWCDWVRNGINSSGRHDAEGECTTETGRRSFSAGATGGHAHKTTSSRDDIAKHGPPSVTLATVEGFLSTVADVWTHVASEMDYFETRLRAGRRQPATSALTEMTAESMAAMCGADLFALFACLRGSRQCTTTARNVAPRHTMSHHVTPCHTTSHHVTRHPPHTTSHYTA